MNISALSLSLTRPGGISLEQLVAGLFSAGEQGAWYDPSGNNTTWRRNRLTYTQEFDNAVWGKTALNTTADWIDEGVAPDATETADKLIEDSSNGEHRLITGAITLAGSYVFSVYVKAAERTKVLLRTLNTTTGRGFDLSNGTSFVASGVATPTGYGITDAGNGWYRCWFTPNMTGNQYIIVALYTTTNSYAGDNASGLYAWGTQLEADVEAPTAYQRIITPEITYLSTVQAQPLLFQNAEGTLPVTEVEQPVGLMLDRRKGLALGSELVTNGTFDSNVTGWTASQNAGTGSIAWSSGRIAVSGNATATYPRATQAWTAVVGKWYALSCSYDVGTTSEIFFAPTPGTSQRRLATSGTTGTINFMWLATTATPTLEIGAWDVSGQSKTCYFDNISVKLLDGNHAYQTSTPARPHLRSRYNLLTYSEQFGTNWSAPSTDIDVTSNAIEAPDGTTTADKIFAKATNSVHRVSQNVSVAASATYTLSIYAKAAERSIFQLKMASGFTVEPIVEFNVSGSGTKTTIQGSPTSTIEAVSGYPGWFRCTITATTSSSATSTNAQCFICQSAGSVFYTGDGTSGIYIWGAQLNLGSTAMSYQRIAALPVLSTPPTYATVSTMGGEVFRPYLWWDGIDDRLLTANMDMSVSDNVSVAAGIMKLSDATRAVFLHLGNLTFNTFRCEAPQAGGGPNFAFYATGSAALQGATATGYPATFTFVYYGDADISDDIDRLYINNALAASDTNDNGTGNFGNAPLYIGMRGDGSLFFNGHLYAIFVCSRKLLDSERETVNKYIASKSGVTL